MAGTLVATRRWHWLMVAVVAGAIAFAGTWWSGLSGSEGHRAVPGWTMAESGDWLRQEMFGTGYLRKPPGMAWAIGASGTLLGECEFSARAVSGVCACLSALLVLRFSARWYRTPWSLAAGLMHAALPLYWSASRSAEIESLHNFGVLCAVYGVMDAALGPSRSRRGMIGIGAVIATGTCAALLAKGPSGAPVLIASMLSICIAARGTRVLLRAPIWAGLAVGMLAGAALWWPVIGASFDDRAVTQGVGEFLWDLSKPGAIAAMGPVALASALPLVLLAAAPFGASAAAEAMTDGEDMTRALRISRALALTTLVSVGFYVLLGVSNPRYAMPAMLGLSPLACYAARGCWAYEGEAGRFGERRRARWRAVFGGRWWIWSAACLAAAAVWIPLSEASRERNSGRSAGRAMGQALAGGGELWADDLIEARPEVLWEAQKGGEGALRVRWMKHEMLAGEVPVAGGLIAMRQDRGSAEWDRYRALVESGALEEVFHGRAAQYEWGVYRVRGR